MKKTTYVSVHGGHSGQFCHHAKDSLEDIVLRYIEKGFSWVGITEHAPPVSEAFLYPCEREAGLTPDSSLKIFGDFIAECRRLQKKYSSEIEIFVAMEGETCSGYQEFIPFLIQKFRPDYIVGSIHFVDDIGFDYSREEYEIAVKTVGGKIELYRRYFDQQYAMLKFLKPAVVGHFDLVRIFDTDYNTRLQHPDILSRIKRNLALIKELDLIMDLNLRALFKGADEPYIARIILEMARKLEIPVVPGDDSHDVNSVGNAMDEGIAILAELGFETHWKKPSKIVY